VNVDPGQRHVVTATAGAGGVISPSGMISVPHGTSQTFVFHPMRGFGISRVLVNGVDIGAVGHYTVSNVTENGTISVEFEVTGSPFLDVRPHHWFYDSVVYVFGEGLIFGTTGTTFSPDVTTTRGMFVTILARMAGVEARDWSHTGTVTGGSVNFRNGPGPGHSVISQVPRNTPVDVIGRVGDWYRISHNNRIGYMAREFVDTRFGTFTDVAPGAFYAPYAEWAAYHGISAGSDDLFHPSRVLTRQEMATMLYNYSTAMGIALRQDNIPPFRDLESVAPWARAGVTAMQRAGVIQGTGNNYFNPHGTSNRAGVATLIANFHSMYIAAQG